MNSEITIATVQFDIKWEDSKYNMRSLDELLGTLSHDIDIVVLPEMFNTGFSMNPKNIALENGGEVLDWMIEKAKHQNFCLVGSIATEENGNFYNRLFWVFPDGSFKTYDKRHLFRMADEHHSYKNGVSKIIISYKGFNFCPLICYDLRFPVWSRNTQRENYDCLIYIANWPTVRSDAWYSLLKARAIENLSYVVGVNRVGKDGNNIEYDGKSVVFDFIGNSIDSHIIGKESISIQTISKTKLNEFRTKFPAHLDADDFEVL